MTLENQQQLKHRNYKSLALWLAIWIAIGVAIGVAIGKPAFGAGVGVPIGVAFWSTQSRRRSR